MTPKKVDLALMCKSHNYKIEPFTNTYRVGDWVIGKKKRQALVGSNVILTESQKSPAYLGGIISGFIPTQDGKCEIVFTQDHALTGNQDSIGHTGWGLKRSVCYI